MSRITEGGEQYHFASYSDTTNQWIVSNQRFVLTEEENTEENSSNMINGIFLSDMWYNVLGLVKERKYLIIQSRAKKIPVQVLVSQLNKTLNEYKNFNQMEKIIDHIFKTEILVMRCAYFTLNVASQQMFMKNKKQGYSGKIITDCVSCIPGEEIMMQLNLYATIISSVEEINNKSMKEEKYENICLSNPEFCFMC